MDSDESSCSDQELQVAFQKGLLKPGLNVEVQTEKQKVNDVGGLKQALRDLQNGLGWVERLDMTTIPLAAPAPLAEQLGDSPDDLTGDGVHDDFKREMKFYRQAQSAVIQGIPKLNVLGISTKRPEDYFAEMAKSDDHMKKVRQKLLAKQISMERSEKAKKLRELRKYGKKVQHEVMLKRQKEKREMADAIKKYKKTGKQDKLDFLEDRTQSTGSQGKGAKSIHQPNKRRQQKNKKFGFGGQKKRSKYNTKESASDMSGYSVRKHGTAPGKGKKGLPGKPRPGNKNKPRPGKRRRQNNKTKKKKVPTATLR